MKRNSDFLLQNVGGENILVPLGAKVLDMNGLVTLNETGACVWEMLAQERSLDELVAGVVDRFDVVPERSLADVQTFVDEIAAIGLLES